MKHAKNDYTIGKKKKSVMCYYCFIPKAMVGWERRMWNVLSEMEVLSAVEHLRIEIKVDSNTR
jgi:hypothetical protein